MKPSTITRFAGDSAVKELRVEIRLKNNRLIRLREELGVRPREMARRIGMSYNTLLHYESMRKSPVGPDGWRPSAQKIADYHGLSCSYIWPEVVRNVERPSTTREMSGAEVAHLVAADRGMPALPPSPQADSRVLRKELTSRVDKVLATLTPREEKVLVHRFGLRGHAAETIEEVRARFDCSRFQIRLIEAKALRKIRHPSRRKLLSMFIEERTGAAGRSPFRIVKEALDVLYAGADVGDTEGLSNIDGCQADFAVSWTALTPEDRHRLRLHELQLRRSSGDCCMNPFCLSDWATVDRVDVSGIRRPPWCSGDGNIDLGCVVYSGVFTCLPSYRYALCSPCFEMLHQTQRALLAAELGDLTIRFLRPWVRYFREAGRTYPQGWTFAETAEFTSRTE